MGRPINKKYFGATGASDATIPVRFHDGSSLIEGYIVSQRSARRFLCSNDGNTITRTCKLVNELNPNAENEMALVDHTGNIMQKISGRKCYDFDGNVFTWEAQDDSTESVFRTTPA